MTSRNLLDAMGGIDPRLILEAAPDAAKPQRAVKQWMKWGAVAACLVVIVGVVLAVPVLRVITLPEIPTWENPQYTAEEISKLFSMTYLDGAATNAYTTVHVPDAKYLYIDDITEDEYLDLYQYTKSGAEVSEQEFQSFLDGILPALADSLQVTAPHCRIKENDSGGLSVNEDVGAYSIHAFQNTAVTAFRLYNITRGDRKIVLDGEIVQVDQRLSDEEIADSLQSIKEKLFAIFHVSFSDVRILRQYDGFSEYGAERVDIYFFDENAHPLNAMRMDERRSIPISDYICISFDNNENYAGDIVSDSMLTVAEIDYYKRRVDVAETYAFMASAKRISLEDAEALLYNGYVFGGHSCPRCMAVQGKVSFYGYDFVDMEYVVGYAPNNETTMCIPFYAFYKKIGTAENGNSIYAKTYVAAIEVSGYTEFFEKQKDEHQNIWE